MHRTWHIGINKSDCEKKYNGILYHVFVERRACSSLDFFHGSVLFLMMMAMLKITQLDNSITILFACVAERGIKKEKLHFFCKCARWLLSWNMPHYHHHEKLDITSSQDDKSFTVQKSTNGNPKGIKKVQNCKCAVLWLSRYGWRLCTAG